MKSNTKDLSYIKLSVKKIEDCNREDCPTEEEKQKFFEID